VGILRQAQDERMDNSGISRELYEGGRVGKDYSRGMVGVLIRFGVDSAAGVR